MSRDDIIKLAREAGFEADESACDVWITDGYWARELERFAALVAAAERNRMVSDGWRQCAKGQRTTQFCGLFETKEKPND
jgi:hypothetical protein